MGSNAASKKIADEIRTAIRISEDIEADESTLASIEAEVAQLELSFEKNSSPDTRRQLLAKYVLLSRWLPVHDLQKAVTLREKFKERFPEHFEAFMEGLRVSGPSVRWTGCLHCRYNVGHACARGLVPRRLPSRYLKVDYECSAFEPRKQ